MCLEFLFSMQCLIDHCFLPYLLFLATICYLQTALGESCTNLIVCMQSDEIIPVPNYHQSQLGTYVVNHELFSALRSMVIRLICFLSPQS